MRYLWVSSLSLIFLSGCAAVTDMAATGGSRADGTVEMSYQYNDFQPVKIDHQKALQSATRRCQSWGYKSAESFDNGLKTCVSPAAFGGCNAYRVTVQYQCLGGQ